MRLLLDTHIAVWAVTDSRYLKPAMRALIADSLNQIFVSAASIWEIGVKFALQRADAPPFSAQQALDAFAIAEFEILDIETTDIVAATTLPPLHGDPFDRMIVAQALGGGMRLVTHDAKLTAYSDTIIRMR